MSPVWSLQSKFRTSAIAAGKPCPKPLAPEKKESVKVGTGTHTCNLSLGTAEAGRSLV